MIIDTMKVVGAVRLVLLNSFGQVKQEIEVPNLIVTTGKTHIANRMLSTTPSQSPMGFMAVGTTNTAPALGNTALAAEVGRQAVTSSVSANVLTYAATFAAGVGTGALVEAGIFNASSAGIMLCRTTFPVINKESGDSLTINWNVTIS